MQPHAKIIETQKAKVDLSEVLGTNSFDIEEVFGSAGWVDVLNDFEKGDHESEHESEHESGHESESDCDHDHEHHHSHDHEHSHEHDPDCPCHDHPEEEAHGHCSCGHHHEPGHSHTEEFGISTFVYYRRKPFDRIKLDEFASNWPATVIRTKGVMWLSDDNLSAYVLEQAGRQINAGYSGDWMATGTKKQIEQAKKEDPEFAKNWDETVGDRMIKLVFIGKDMNKEKIIADLDACLVEPKLK